MPNKLNQNDIKDLRARAKMTLQQMGDYLGVTKMTIIRWEKGQSRPSQLAKRQLHRLKREVDL